MSAVKRVEGCYDVDCKCKPDEVKKVCSGCKIARYCGEAHQKRHWPIHKQFCAKGIVNNQPDVVPFCSFGIGTPKRCDKDAISWYLPFCPEHCKNEKDGCALQGCAVPARINSIYCSIHACGDLECEHRYTCCPDHGFGFNRLDYDLEPGQRFCSNRFCSKLITTGSIYCNDHECPFDFQPRQLCGHICALEDCENPLSAPTHVFCVHHTCKSDLCEGPWPECGHVCQYGYEGFACNRYATSKFCSQHACSKCNKNVSIDECEHCCKYEGCEFNDETRMPKGVCWEHRCQDKLCDEVCRDFHDPIRKPRFHRGHAWFCETHTCSYFKKKTVDGASFHDYCAQKAEQSGHCQKHKFFMPDSGHKKAGMCECDKCTGFAVKSANKR